jgi:formate-dependent nitrite reductase cytochrome c552 subunit
MANVFPKWANFVPIKIIIGIVFVLIAITSIVTYYFTPKYTRVGYQPTQPVAFSHKLHAGQLGMDCRFCHNHVDESAHANVPSTSTCMSCHSIIKTQSAALAPIRASYENDKPVEWVKIHKVPDYVYFNHSIHVNRGISCVECHGRIDQMEVVHHDQSLSMSWCLECHNNPEEKIRPLDKVYDLKWKAESKEAQLEMGMELVHDWNVNPPISCSGCHR